MLKVWYFIFLMDSNFESNQISSHEIVFQVDSQRFLTKTSDHPFKACIRLFEQMSTCCKQVATCFKLADTFSNGTIFWFLKILVCKINLDDMCCLK